MWMRKGVAGKRNKKIRKMKKKIIIQCDMDEKKCRREEK